MIEFNGKMSRRCYIHIIKANRKIATICALIVSLIVSIPIIISIFTWNYIMVLALPCLVLFVALAGIEPKDVSIVVPTKITIDNEEIVAKSDKFCVEKFICDVKQVLDYGDCYHILFLTRPFCPNYVCQKI